MGHGVSARCCCEVWCGLVLSMDCGQTWKLAGHLLTYIEGDTQGDV